MTTPRKPPEELVLWLAAHGRELVDLEPLAGDVSARRYHRLTLVDGATAVLALYPPEMVPACHRFQVTTRLLEGAGVRVPEMLAADCAAGRMLLEDVGAETLDRWADGRSWSEVLPRFRAALAAERRIAALPPERPAELSPPLDRELLAQELAMTRRHFLEPRGLLGDPGLADDLERVLDALVDVVAAAEPVPCHRDFMVRNLVPRPRGDVAVLDHQDLRLGPPLYDLASLLNDTLFPPPDAEEELLASRGADTGATRLDYHRVAAQRTLKAVGSYAWAAERGVTRHLAAIPPTLDRALTHLAETPEAEDLAPALRQHWAAALERPGSC